MSKHLERVAEVQRWESIKIKAARWEREHGRSARSSNYAAKKLVEARATLAKAEGGD